MAITGDGLKGVMICTPRLLSSTDMARSLRSALPLNPKSKTRTASMTSDAYVSSKISLARVAQFVVTSQPFSPGVIGGIVNSISFFVALLETVGYLYCKTNKTPSGRRLKQ